MWGGGRSDSAEEGGRSDSGEKGEGRRVVRRGTPEPSQRSGPAYGFSPPLAAIFVSFILLLSHCQF